MRVLIIDDSRAMRAILRGATKTLGFEAVEAANGQEGLSGYRQTVRSISPWSIGTCP